MLYVRTKENCALPNSYLKYSSVMNTVHLIVYCCIHSSLKSTNNLGDDNVLLQAKGWFCLHATIYTCHAFQATFCLISFGDIMPYTLKVNMVSTK
jgi:hypothetical protein